MATLVIYFSLMEIRPLNQNLSGGRHQLAQAAWTALHEGSAGDGCTHPAMLTHPLFVQDVSSLLVWF